MSGCKISSVGLGMSLGVLWGVSVLILGLLAHAYSYGQPFVTTMGAIYVGYVPSVKGSILGGILAFINAFITGFLIAWLYNMFNCCACACCKKEDKKA